MSLFKRGFLPVGFALLLSLVMIASMGAEKKTEGTNQILNHSAEVNITNELPDERPIAFVRRFKPNVRIFNLNAEKFKKAEKAEKLYDGDTLATGESGYAAVQFMDNSLAKVTPSSLLLINGSVDNNTQSTSTRILLNAGEIMMDVKKNRGDFEVATQTSVATVKGTQFGSSSEQSGESFHFVLEGSVQVDALESDQTTTITSGQFARVSSDGQDIETGELEADDLKQRQDEFNQFDQRMEPKKLQFEFRGEDGEVRQIEIEYYENGEN